MATFSTNLNQTKVGLIHRLALILAFIGALLIVGLTPLHANTVGAEPTASPVTPAWEAFLPTPKPVGEGQFRRWGFLIYDATLWSSTGQYVADKPFALSLAYARTVTRDQIVEASIDQLRDVGVDVDQHPTWAEKLRKVFVDVKPGDTLTGIYTPKKGAVFFYNNQKTGQVDEALAQAFFSIWLDPKTTAPKLRLSLLGQAQ